MLTLGYITRLNETGDNLFRVRIPIFEKAGSSKNLPDLSGSYFDAVLNQEPGQSNAFKIGDCVVIGFLDNKLEKPVILGKLYIDDKESRGVLNADSSVVTGKAILPKEITIGDITYSDLTSISRAVDLFNTKLNSIITSVIESATYYNSYVHGGVTYYHVLVIKFENVDEPVIVPMDSIVEGLVTEEQLEEAIDEVTPDFITSQYNASSISITLVNNTDKKIVNLADTEDVTFVIPSNISHGWVGSCTLQFGDVPTFDIRNQSSYDVYAIINGIQRDVEEWNTAVTADSTMEVLAECNGLNVRVYAKSTED